eukprot:gene21605-27964_t
MNARLQRHEAKAVHLSGFSRGSAGDGGLRPSSAGLAAPTRASRGQTPKSGITGWSEKDRTSAVCAVTKRETRDSRIALMRVPRRRDATQRADPTRQRVAAMVGNGVPMAGDGVAGGALGSGGAARQAVWPGLRDNAPRKPGGVVPWQRRRLTAGDVLLQAGVDGFELGRQAGADVRPDGDADHRDQGRDQAVLDGGGAGLILGEASENVGHVKLLWNHGLTAAFALKWLWSASSPWLRWFDVGLMGGMPGVSSPASSVTSGAPLQPAGGSAGLGAMAALSPGPQDEAERFLPDGSVVEIAFQQRDLLAITPPQAGPVLAAGIAAADPAALLPPDFGAPAAVGNGTAVGHADDPVEPRQFGAVADGFLSQIGGVRAPGRLAAGIDVARTGRGVVLARVEGDVVLVLRAAGVGSLAVSVLRQPQGAGAPVDRVGRDRLLVEHRHPDREGANPVIAAKAPRALRISGGGERRQDESGEGADVHAKRHRCSRLTGATNATGGQVEEGWWTGAGPQRFLDRFTRSGGADRVAGWASSAIDLVPLRSQIAGSETSPQGAYKLGDLVPTSDA